MKRNTHIDWFFKSAAIACLVLGYASCADDEEVASLKNQGKSDVVTFDISTMYRWTPDVIGDSRSVASEMSSSNVKRTEAVPMDCEGGMQGTEIYMYMIEEDIPVVVDTLKVESRNTEAEVQTPPIGILATHTIDDQTSVFMENISHTDYKDDKYWPGKGDLKFYAYTPYLKTLNAEENGLTLKWNDNHQPTFEYVVSEESMHQDLMDGASDVIQNGFSTSAVTINLAHILSQIQVKKGTLNDVEVKIKSVSFTNIYSAGSRVMASSEGWVIDYEKGTKNSYSQSKEDDGGFTIPTEGENKDCIGSAMFLMPQNLAEEAEIEIELSVTSPDPNNEGVYRTNDYTLTKKLHDLQKDESALQWAPNKKYTYVLSTPEEVKVEVTDEVVADTENRPVKTNLHIKNTGLSVVYIRASILGNWVLPNDTPEYDDDYIVAAWKPDEEGVFEWGDSEPKENNSTGWCKHSDGYYYYLNPVARNSETAPLFKSYTLTATPPMAGAVLDMTIIVQAVLKDDAAHVWPKEITEQFVNAAPDVSE